MPAKPLSLIKPPSQSIAISVVPAKAPVSMVTAHINGQKTANSDVLQTSPINLQTANRAHRPGELCHSQVTPPRPAPPRPTNTHKNNTQHTWVLKKVREEVRVGAA